MAFPRIFLNHKASNITVVADTVAGRRAVNRSTYHHDSSDNGNSNGTDPFIVTFTPAAAAGAGVGVGGTEGGVVTVVDDFDLPDADLSSATALDAALCLFEDQAGVACPPVKGAKPVITNATAERVAGWLDWLA